VGWRDEEVTVRNQDPDDSMEHDLIGTSDGTEMTDVETLLRRCDECQDAVRKIDQFLGGIRAAAEHLQLYGCGPSLEGFQGEYHIIQTALPDATTQNIGILLIGESDRLYCRFRDDLKEFAGAQAAWLKQLCDEISAKADQLGAQMCLEWLLSIAPRVIQISPCKSVLIEHSAAATLDLLFAKHIRTHVLHFRTHLPERNLETAAGKL
jgi:hypothetical protein